MLRHVLLAVATMFVGLGRSEAAPPPNLVVILADNPLNHGFDGFSGMMDTDHQYLFWGSKASGAVRSGDWKLVNSELYNLRNDLTEKNNLVAAHPDIGSRLRNARADWARGLAPALW